MKTSALVIGCSGGIGQALCRAFRQKGYSVEGISRRRDGFRIEDPESVRTALAKFDDGAFDRIVVSTGVLTAPGQSSPEKALSELSKEHLLSLLEVNAVGPALVLSELPRLFARSQAAGGHVAVGVLSARVGSIGDNGLGGWFSYRASKACLNALLRGAALEWARAHRLAAGSPPPVIAVALHPGTVDTEFTRRFPNHRKVSPGQAAGNLVDVLENLTVAQNGSFLDYAGKSIVW